MENMGLTFKTRSIANTCILLPEEHKRILEDRADMPILSEVYAMTPEQLKHYDSYVPKSQEHFNALQRRWMKKEGYFLGEKLNHEPSSLELIEDKSNRHLSEIFRAFYVIKYPRMVEKINRNSGNGNSKGICRISPDVRKRRNSVDSTHEHYPLAFDI